MKQGRFYRGIQHQAFYPKDVFSRFKQSDLASIIHFRSMLIGDSLEILKVLEGKKWHGGVFENHRAETDRPLTRQMILVSRTTEEISIVLLWKQGFIVVADPIDEQVARRENEGRHCRLNRVLTAHNK